MTNPCYYFLISLLIISGIPGSDSSLLDSQSLERSKYERQGLLEPFEKSVPGQSSKNKRFFGRRLNKQLTYHFGVSGETFPPKDMVAQCNDEIYARYFRWKDDTSDREKCATRDKLKNKFRRKRKKDSFRNLRKRYLDYTNSQMPFNEGTKASKFAQVEKTVSKNERESSNMEALRGIVDEFPEGYSRVRRFLDHERAKKRLWPSSTLEAKEAAMSRILDPNLNLDGNLEPHVRKRRDDRELKVVRQIQNIRSKRFG